MERQGEIESPRFLSVAALTVAASLIPVLVVREVAVRVLHPKPRFAPLTLGPPVLDTVVCVIVAIFVFVKIAPDSGGVWPWRLVATLVLVLSFIPDVLLARSHEMGGGWPEAYALMIMHVAVWAICITLLPELAYRAGGAADKPDRLSHPDRRPDHSGRSVSASS
jgi:hypothetical protein